MSVASQRAAALLPYARRKKAKTASSRRLRQRDSSTGFSRQLHSLSMSSRGQSQTVTAILEHGTLLI